MYRMLNLVLLLILGCAPGANDFAGLERYREENARLPPPKDSENRVIFLGDSITDGWPLEQYFPEKSYLNRGISGQTTLQMLGRFRQDVIQLHPKSVVILAGTNDITRLSDSASLEGIKANFESMVELSQMHQIRVVLCSVLPVNDYNSAHRDSFAAWRMEKIRELNEWLREYSLSHQLLYIDYFTSMVDDAGYLRRELADDGLHPNLAGYAIMAELVKSALD